jgi:glycosyltransferase involved in cell wall biosynthesis
MRRVLIVSPYFPPSTVAGVHRARILAKYLSRWGWEPIVFCVEEQYHEQELDPDLAALMDPTVRVIKVAAWPTRLCRRFGLGDLGIRGYPYLKRAVEQFLRREGGDLLFVTVLPGFPIRMGPVFKRRYHLPFVIDYQDPWLPRDYEAATPLSKLWCAHQIAASSEPRVLPWADHITAVSPGTHELLQSRYAFLPADRLSAIPIGVDADDYASLRQGQRACPWVRHEAGIINICYVGNIWTRAHRTVQAIFAALGALRGESPRLYHRLRLTFVGTSNQPLTSAGEVVMPVAHAAGIADIVREIPGRVPYLDALTILLRADIVLLLGSDEPHYTASKLYPALLAERPLFGVFHERSSVCEVMREVGGGKLVTFSDTAPVETKVAEIADMLKTLVLHPEAVGSVAHARIAPYLGPAIAKQFAEIFNHVVEQH